MQRRILNLKGLSFIRISYERRKRIITKIKTYDFRQRDAKEKIV